MPDFGSLDLGLSPAQLRTGGPSPSHRAMFGVAVDMQGLNKTLTAAILALRLNTTKAVIETAFELQGAVAERTPVDTGRARASWHVVVYGQGDTYHYKDRHGNEFDGKIETTPTSPTMAVMGSNVEYMPNLEAGSSKQAPAGMVRVSVAEISGKLVEKMRQRMR